MVAIPSATAPPPALSNERVWELGSPQFVFLNALYFHSNDTCPLSIAHIAHLNRFDFPAAIALAISVKFNVRRAVRQLVVRKPRRKKEKSATELKVLRAVESVDEFA